MLRSLFSNKKREREGNKAAEKETNAAITIQKHMRGYLARKKYRVPHLHKYDMESYPAFVVGNDPIINGHEAHKVTDSKVALVATSGIRAILLACDLGNFKETPKILLVDNSRQVCDFWIAMREYIQNDTLTGTCEDFRKNLRGFLSDNYSLYRDIPDFACMADNTPEVRYPNQNIAKFFDDMFDKHGYANVRAVIKHASVIKQSWESKATFETIKNILDLHGIEKVFAYPSNIIGCTQDKGRELVILQNIAKLRPVMTVYTEGVLSGNSMHSGKAHCLESCDPAFVSKELKVDENRFSGMGDEQHLLAILSLFGGNHGGGGIRIVSISGFHSNNHDDEQDFNTGSHHRGGFF